VISTLGPLQRVLYQRLSTDAPLLARGYATYDEPPETATRYLVIGDGNEAPLGTLDGRGGNQGTETVHLWFEGASTLQAREDADLVRAALEEPLAIEGQTVARFKPEFTETLKEQGRTPDEPSWRHVVIRFRYWIREGEE
jgi:hypothetical protein